MNAQIHGSVRFSSGTGDDSRTITWSPPPPSSRANHDHHSEVNDRKRRRVQVKIVKQGVAMLQLGSDLTYDFRLNHAETEDKVASVTAERDSLRRALDAVEDELRITRGDYQASLRELDDIKYEFNQYKMHHGQSNGTVNQLRTKLHKITQSRLSIIENRNQLLETIKDMEEEKLKSENERNSLREKVVECVAAQGRQEHRLRKVKALFRADLECARKEAAFANRHWDEARNEIKVAIQEMDSIRKEAQAEKHHLVQQRHQLQKELDFAKGNHEECRDENKRLMQHNESLKKEYQGCKISHDELVDGLRNAQQTTTEAQAQLHDTQRELEHSREKYATLITEMRLLEETKMAQTNQLGSERCEHLREKREATEKHSKAEAEIKQLRDQIHNLRSELRSDTLENEGDKLLVMA
ncbi:hypothetical protein CTA2_10327 [Colletotrichum tanaceti]|uniref:Uncharacterized protein n=1 Tax=Colletotrichum tanaceti TaxID=1306861 RepID=A0A4U6XAZ5_9PEZI|nr:hypothetical protein CTA2_10327 [Colletotrichum tanaceti]TKW52858.1 hypothetical protein CTA1_11882 [Colletotrichum tanaceti]